MELTHRPVRTAAPWLLVALTLAAGFSGGSRQAAAQALDRGYGAAYVYPWEVPISVIRLAPNAAGDADKRQAAAQRSTRVGALAVALPPPLPSNPPPPVGPPNTVTPAPDLSFDTIGDSG